MMTPVNIVKDFNCFEFSGTTAEHRRFTASRSIMMPTDEFLVRTGVFVILAFRVKWRWHTTPTISATTGA